MATELRNTGISVVGEIPWGTHFCHFYETREDLLDILVPYFKRGLEDNEVCIWVVFDPINEGEARAVLKGAIPDADRHLAAGDIEIVPYAQWYFREGMLDVPRVIKVLNEKLELALARGKSGVRANGNEAWLTRKDWRDFQDYENRLNAVIAGKKLIVMCTYPLALSNAAEIFDVARSHEFSIARRHGSWEILETPELKQAKAALKKLNEQLEARVRERTVELEVCNEQLVMEVLERKQAEAALKKLNEQLRALSARLHSTQEEEATRIAREMHDVLGQKLTVLKLDLLWSEQQLEEMKSSPEIHALLDRVVGATELVDEIGASAHEIAAALRPGVLDTLGLGIGLQYAARRFHESSGIICEVEAPADATFGPQISTALFRIFQECLTNIARHAQATNVEAELKVEHGWITLRVADNGRGITEAEIAHPGALGLLGMKERAALLGGEFDIQRGPDRGTIVSVGIPQAETVPPHKEPV